MPQSWTSFVMTGQYKRTKLPETNATDAYRRDKVEVSTFSLASKPLAGYQRGVDRYEKYSQRPGPCRPSVCAQALTLHRLRLLNRILISERSYRGLVLTQSGLCRFVHLGRS